MKPVTVLTVTRGRKSLLARCIESVKKQRCAAQVKHLILIDGCTDTYESLRQNYSSARHLTCILRLRRSHEQSGPAHLAHLRNFMVRMADTPYISFLDDDNEYEPHHLQALLAHIQSVQVPAAHAWIQVFNFDGSPYLEPVWPWCRDKTEGARCYQKFLRKGVVAHNSNVIKDSVQNLPERCVDTNTWLIERDTLLDNPISEEFSLADWDNNKAEDDKLLIGFLTAGIPISCNNTVSVRYYLGGYSTNHTDEHQHSIKWERKSLKQKNSP